VRSDNDAKLDLEHDARSRSPVHAIAGARTAAPAATAADVKDIMSDGRTQLASLATASVRELRA